MLVFLTRRVRPKGWHEASSKGLLVPKGLRSMTILTPLATLDVRAAAYRAKSAMDLATIFGLRMYAPRFWVPLSAASYLPCEPLGNAS